MHPAEMTFVAQGAPECSPDLRVSAPGAPAPFDTAPPALRLEGLERFACDQVGLPHPGQQEQDGGRQVSQVVVPGLVLVPTPRDLPAQDGQSPFGWLSSLVT